MKAKEARKIIKEMAEGKFYKMQSELLESENAGIKPKLTHKAYIIGHCWTNYYPTWEEVISQLKRFQEGSLV